MRRFICTITTLTLCIAQPISSETLYYLADGVEHYNVDRNYHYLSLEEFEHMLRIAFDPQKSRIEQMRSQLHANAENDHCRAPTVKPFTRNVLARRTLRALCLTH